MDALYERVFVSPTTWQLFAAHDATEPIRCSVCATDRPPLWIGADDARCEEHVPRFPVPAGVR